MKTTSVSPKLHKQINHSINIYRKAINHRDDKLFSEFLVNGYQYTTLSSVDDCYLETVMNAKFHLGMLITLIDDFADNPQYFDSALLTEIYKIPFSIANTSKNSLTERELPVMQLVQYLTEQIALNVETLPHYTLFESFFKFDMQRIYQANQYSSLITKNSSIVNTSELTELRPFNMGMVLASMIDIFASSQFNLKELGIARQIFHFGQRYGSICNNLTTFTREVKEGDVTNEILVKSLSRKIITKQEVDKLPLEHLLIKLACVLEEMELEQSNIIARIQQETIESFDVQQYIKGLLQLKLLHEKMEGII